MNLPIFSFNIKIEKHLIHQNYRNKLEKKIESLIRIEPILNEKLIKKITFK
jgi:hypothetical protein